MACPYCHCCEINHSTIAVLYPISLFWDQPLNHIDCKWKFPCTMFGANSTTQPQIFKNGSVHSYLIASQANILTTSYHIRCPFSTVTVWYQPLNHSCDVSNSTVVRSTTQPHWLQIKIVIHDVWYKLNHSTTRIKK